MYVKDLPHQTIIKCAYKKYENSLIRSDIRLTFAHTPSSSGIVYIQSTYIHTHKDVKMIAVVPFSVCSVCVVCCRFPLYRTADISLVLYVYGVRVALKLYLGICLPNIKKEA